MQSALSSGLQSITNAAAVYFGEEISTEEQKSIDTDISTSTATTIKPDYAALSAELYTLIENLSVEVEKEKGTEEWYSREAEKSEKGLHQLREKVRILEQELSTLEHESDQLQKETDKTTENFQKTIKQRDELRLQSNTMKEEIETMEINRLKDIAEMEQLRSFFSNESQVMISNLLMNNQQLETKKEQSEIDLRHVKEENEALQDELKNLEAEKELVSTQLTELENQEGEAKCKYDDAIMEQESLREKLGIKNNRRWPTLNKFLLKRGGGPTSSASEVHTVCSAPIFKFNNSKKMDHLTKQGMEIECSQNNNDTHNILTVTEAEENYDDLSLS